MHFPTDYAYEDKFSEDNKTVIRIYEDDIDNGWLGLDIGLNSIKTSADIIKDQKIKYVTDLVVYLKWNLSQMKNAW